jgi:hypothetical protein
VGSFIDRILPYGFPIVFVGAWLAITWALANRSGWLDLARRFPDRSDAPVLRLWWRSGWMSGRVSFTNCLSFTACQSGLRVGIFRMLGPFSRSFLVPWRELDVIAHRSGAELRLGKPALGTLIVSVQTANRLARAVPDYWPSAGMLPEPTVGAVLRRIWLVWAIITALCATFFTITTRLTWPKESQVPIAILVLWPAIAFGIVPAIQSIAILLRRRRT